MRIQMKIGDRRKTNPLHSALLSFSFLAAAGPYAHASVALLMEELYGGFGAINPTGHAAVFFNHICADSPVVLRACHDGEYHLLCPSSIFASSSGKSFSSTWAKFSDSVAANTSRGLKSAAGFRLASSRAMAKRKI
jgi:hypothetical protein